MDSRCRKYLKFIRAYKPNYEPIDINPLYNDYSKHSNLKHLEIVAMTRHLEKHGYIAWGKNSQGKVNAIILEYRGIYPHTVGWHDLQQTLFTSVLLPILVSAVTTIITALITLWITGFFQLSPE